MDKRPGGDSAPTLSPDRYDFVSPAEEGEVGQVGAGRSRDRRFRRIYICVAALAAALALAVAPAGATAASPVLEFAAPAAAFPIDFTADGGEVTAALAEFEGTIVRCSDSEGEGVVAGPRSAFSRYFFTGCEAEGGSHDNQECKTVGADPKEIQSELIEAELVFIDQAKHEVAMLLNPGEDTYIEFECGGEDVEGFGSFLSPVGPLNQQTTSFTAELTRDEATQVPNEYENANGEKLLAIPMGEREGHPAATTGVELSFSILTDSPLEIKAISAAEVAEAEAKKHEEEAAAKKRQEEEAAAKKHQEEEAAAAKKRQEEQQAKEERLKRHRQLSKALTQCRKGQPSKHKRMRCEKRAKKKYGDHGASSRPVY